MTSAESWALAAANSSASAHGASSPSGSSTMRRIRSPVRVPPGSRTAVTGRPRAWRSATTPAATVDFPAPSTPFEGGVPPGHELSGSPSG